MCRCVVGCLVDLCELSLFLFDVFVADLFVTFAGEGGVVVGGGPRVQYPEKNNPPWMNSHKKGGEHCKGGKGGG